jgi:hypothetical protein
MERVEVGCPRGGEEEGVGGGGGKGVERVVGWGCSHPSDLDQRPEHALPSELPTPVEKMPKDLLFP